MRLRIDIENITDKQLKNIEIKSELPEFLEYDVNNAMYDFGKALNTDTTVYAKWNEVKAKIESDVLPSTGYQNSAPIIAISIVVLGGMILIARKRNK